MTYSAWNSILPLSYPIPAPRKESVSGESEYGVPVSLAWRASVLPRRIVQLPRSSTRLSESSCLNSAFWSVMTEWMCAFARPTEA
jgi:hypothetical protein